MRYFNGFKVMQVLVGGLTQWALFITALVFFVKTIAAFSVFNIMMIPLCLLGIIVCAMFQPLFYLCAAGRQMEIDELERMDNE